MQKYKSNITSTTGAAIRNVPVTVLTEAGELASLFLDRAGAIAAPNPLNTDSSGNFYFYAVNGRYSLRTTVEGVTITDDDVVLLQDPVEITVAGPIAEAIQRAEAAAKQAKDVVSDAKIPDLVATAQNALQDANQATALARQSITSANAANQLAQQSAGSASASAASASAAADAAAASAQGSLKQMQGFGLGVQFLPATLVNIDAPDTASGSYRVVPATTGTKPAGAPTNGVVDLIRFNDLDCRQIYYGIGTSAAGKKVWVRHIAWNGIASLPTPWVELAAAESPAFTGSPSAPSIKLGNVTSSDTKTLDFYEEGVFAPILFGGETAGSNTYSNNRGLYTRIGDTVLWSAQFQLTATSGMTGQLKMGGLPFGSQNTGAVRGAVSIGYYNAFADASAYDIRAFHAANGATVDFLKRPVGATTPGGFPSTEITNNSQLYVSGHYKAA